MTFDAEWRRTGGWLFPPSALERMAPYAASGGAIGPDGWLYLLGHDRPEMYVVARPSMGPTMIHLATIDLEAEGQAFAWAQDGSRSDLHDRPAQGTGPDDRASGGRRRRPGGQPAVQVAREDPYAVRGSTDRTLPMKAENSVM